MNCCTKLASVTEQQKQCHKGKRVLSSSGKIAWQTSPLQTACFVVDAESNSQAKQKKQCHDESSGHTPFLAKLSGREAHFDQHFLQQPPSLVMPGLQPDGHIWRMQHGLVQAPVTQKRKAILVNWTAPDRHCQQQSTHYSPSVASFRPLSCQVCSLTAT